MKYGLSDIYDDSCSCRLLRWIYFNSKLNEFESLQLAQHGLLFSTCPFYIICVRNKFSQFCVICVGAWNLGVLNVRTYMKFGRVLEQMCVFRVRDVRALSRASVHVCTRPHLCILWDSCACLEVYIRLTVSSCIRRCRSIKGEMRTERVINAAGVWGHTDFLFTFPTLEKQRLTLESMSRPHRSSEAMLL